VEEIAGRIAEDRPLAAEAWVEEIFASLLRLEQFPESGREVPEVRRAEVREVIQGKYRVIYRIESEEISVLTVRDSRQQTTPEDLA
jgi:plasmid stabilization system protein ParE